MDGDTASCVLSNEAYTSIASSVDERYTRDRVAVGVMEEMIRYSLGLGRA